MKPRLLFYLTLALGGGLWIAFISSGRLAGWLYETGQKQDQPDVVRTTPEGIWAKKLKMPWTDEKIVLYRATGEAVQLDAKEAVYTVWSVQNPAKPGRKFDETAAAFIDPATSNVWLGGVDTGETEGDDHFGKLTYTNLFIETGSEILRGDNVLSDGTFDCNESVIKKAQPGEGLDSVIRRFDSDTDGSWPFSHALWLASFGDDFREDFFSSGTTMGSQDTPIQHIQVRNGKLRLDIDSPRYGTAGSVWLDLKTLRPRQAVEYLPGQFNSETFCRGVVPALAALLAAVGTILLAKNSRAKFHYAFTAVVLAVLILSLAVLYRFYVLGLLNMGFPENLFNWLGDLAAQSEWWLSAPQIVIGAMVILVAAQALSLRLLNHRKP